jgi:hypothetical protein
MLTGLNFDMNYQFKFKAADHRPGVKHLMGVTIPEGYNCGEEALYMLATPCVV